MYPKKIDVFRQYIDKNLDIIQMNLEMACPKNLDKIQTKFRQPMKNLDKFRLGSKFF